MQAVIDPPPSQGLGGGELSMSKIQAPVRAPVGCLTVFDWDFYDPDSVQYLRLQGACRAGSTEPDPTEHVDCHGYIREYVRDFGVS
jgi:hypothetical protein